ncbi:zinc-finger associated domain containing protein, partial [Oryctes borbonicus]
EFIRKTIFMHKSIRNILNMEIDVANKCRACLSDSPLMLALFDTYENDLTLADILQQFLNIQLHLYDNLPKGICQECATNLIQFYNFSVVFEESNKKLQNLVDTSIEFLFDESKLVTADFKAPINIQESNITSTNHKENKCLLDRTDDKHEINNTSEDLCDTASYSNDEITLKVENNGEYEEIVIRTTDESTVVTDDNKHICSLCNKTFQNFLLLRKHLQMHIRNKKYICEVCGYVTMRKSYLTDHMETHSLNKPYKCNFCSKSFRCRSTFSRHKRIHTNPKQVVCEMCGQKFTDRGTLKTHILLLHIKSRNFKCIVCGQTFPLKATLEKHLRRHQQKEGATTKNFKCTECDMQYFDKSSLKRHYLIKHSGEYSKYKCQLCYKEYTTKKNLDKHISVHHKF